MGSLPQFIERLVEAYGTETLFEVVTVDAGMTSAENARVISGANLRYMMAIKDNQPTLLAKTQHLTGQGNHKQVEYVCAEATPWVRYRGKQVRRELYRSTDIAGWPEWESARQVWRVKQTTREDNGKTTVENRYFITNLPKDRLTSREILELVRLHWGVENGCHWTLDMVLGEDDNVWCTKNKALRMLSWIRLLAYNLLRMLRHRYLRSARSRSMPWDDLRRFIAQSLCDAHAWVGAADAEVNAATL